MNRVYIVLQTDGNQTEVIAVYAQGLQAKDRADALNELYAIRGLSFTWEAWEVTH